MRPTQRSVLARQPNRNLDGGWSEETFRRSAMISRNIPKNCSDEKHNVWCQNHDPLMCFVKIRRAKRLWIVLGFPSAVEFIIFYDHNASAKGNWLLKESRTGSREAVGAVLLLLVLKVSEHFFHTFNLHVPSKRGPWYPEFRLYRASTGITYCSENQTWLWNICCLNKETKFWVFPYREIFVLRALLEFELDTTHQ